MKKKQHLDFEVNLIPFIDLLSVCICFLLLTAVWIQVASMNVKQAIGGQPQSETEKKPMVWVYLGKDGELSLDIQDSKTVPGNLRKIQLPALDQKINFERLSATVGQIKTLDPLLSSVLIQPLAKSSYEDIIRVMDEFKRNGLSNLGVSPL
jgi:biopolymer transport protein TolR